MLARRCEMSATKRQYRKKPVSDSEEGDGLNGVESQTGGVDTYAEHRLSCEELVPTSCPPENFSKKLSS